MKLETFQQQLNQSAPPPYQHSNNANQAPKRFKLGEEQRPQYLTQQQLQMLQSLQSSRVALNPQQQHLLHSLTQQYKLMQQHQQMTRLQQQQLQQSPMGIRPIHATDRSVPGGAMVPTPGFGNDRNFNSQQSLPHNQDGLQKQFKTEGNFNLECQDLSEFYIVAR